ncbi:hypothetical protein CWC11_09150 [Pseudoalteromonas sp. S3178]|nr:hypothetical protein CWC11_09150 [Pseudoalteromonas sp. S3178]
MLYQSAIILNQFEGLNLTLTALKISDIGQLNNEIFAWLSTRFSHLRIDHLIKRIAIKKGRVGYQFIYKFKGDRMRLRKFQTNI